MIGSAMAMDLARTGWSVCVADVREAHLERLRRDHNVDTVQADLSDPAEVTRVARRGELVLGALPSAIGLQTLAAVIAAGRNYVDISFMPEDGRRLDADARAQDVTAVIDCGVAPGVSNLIAGHAAQVLAPCERIQICVGGLPAERRWPFEYKAGFAPHDVIEEYVRPARQVEHGQVVVYEALSEPEPVDFPGVGTLEAFHTDGLRSLTDSLDVPFMQEKTLRYPGHAGLMRALRASGFFSREPLEVDGRPVRPLDVTAALLFPRWTFAEGEADLTVMRVVAEGRCDGERQRRTWDLLDRYDPESGLRSMSRTTAFPATIMAGLLADGAFRRPGVHAPETVGAVPGLLERILDALQQRGVHWRASVAKC